MKGIADILTAIKNIRTGKSMTFYARKSRHLDLYFAESGSIHKFKFTKWIPLKTFAMKMLGVENLHE